MTAKNPGSLGQLNTTPADIGATKSPEDDELYASPQELLNMYGCSVTEGQVRYAMSLMHTTCNRKSLWPETYEQTLQMERGESQLAVHPVVRLVSAGGRYTYGRKDRISMSQANLDTLGSTLIFGSPPAWEQIDVNLIDVVPSTGQILLPTGIFLVNYNEVAVRYVAGYQSIPDRAIAALITIINDVASMGSANRKTHTVGTVRSEFFGPGFVSEAAKSLLAPFIVTALF